MTPEELEIVRADGEAVRRDADRFSRAFYDTLFEIAPSTRALFDDDLSVQRGKLVDELAFLVEAATSADGHDGLQPFVERARELGRRHERYGVRVDDYEPVRIALIAALREIVDGFSAERELAWAKLYRLISSVMQEASAAGAATAR